MRWEKEVTGVQRAWGCGKRAREGARKKAFIVPQPVDISLSSISAFYFFSNLKDNKFISSLTFITSISSLSFLPSISISLCFDDFNQS